MLLTSESHGSVAKCADNDESNNGEKNYSTKDWYKDGPWIKVRGKLLWGEPGSSVQIRVRGVAALGRQQRGGRLGREVRGRNRGNGANLQKPPASWQKQPTLFSWFTI